MGKRTIVTTEKEELQTSKETKVPKKAPVKASGDQPAQPAASGGGTSGSAGSRKRIEVGILHVQSTYNNTKLLLTDKKGNAIAAASAGSLGFKGAKKGTPFAAAKVGETLAAKVQPMGLKEVSIIVKGTGSGRESSIRGFTSKGIMISLIQDATPVPYNGPKAPRARRV